MAKLNFKPNDTPVYTEAGITWTYNFTLGVWSSDAQDPTNVVTGDSCLLTLKRVNCGSALLMLKKVVVSCISIMKMLTLSNGLTCLNLVLIIFLPKTMLMVSPVRFKDDIAEGAITFKGLTTHEAGIRSNGETVSIKSDGFADTADSFDRFAAFEGNMRANDTNVVGQVFISITTGLLSGKPINRLTCSFRTISQTTKLTIRRTVATSGLTAEETMKISNGYIAFGGFGQSGSAVRPTLKVTNVSDGLPQASGSAVDVASFRFPVNLVVGQGII